MSDEGDRLYAGVTIGTTVYTEHGDPLGTVRGLDADGFYVLGSDEASIKRVTEAREITGRDYVMWRCWKCGEMGKIEGSLPAECPDCDAPREELYYWVED